MESQWCSHGKGLRVAAGPFCQAAPQMGIWGDSHLRQQGYRLSVSRVKRVQLYCDFSKVNMSRKTRTASPSHSRLRRRHRRCHRQHVMEYQQTSAAATIPYLITSIDLTLMISTYIMYIFLFNDNIEIALF